MATDLSAVKSCEILEDKREPDHFQTRIVGGGGIQDYDYEYSVENAAAPLPEVQAFKVQADSAFDGAPEPILESPKVELRTFFPENWLFDLQYNNDTTLTR